MELYINSWGTISTGEPISLFSVLWMLSSLSYKSWLITCVYMCARTLWKVWWSVCVHTQVLGQRLLSWRTAQVSGVCDGTRLSTHTATPCARTQPTKWRETVITQVMTTSQASNLQLSYHLRMTWNCGNPIVGFFGLEFGLCFGLGGFFMGFFFLVGFFVVVLFCF